MLANTILLIVTSVVALFIVALVLLAHSVRPRLKFSFAMSVLSIVLWQVTIYVSDTVHTHLMLWNHLVFLWPTLAVMSFYLFVTLLRPASASEILRPSNKRGYVINAISVGAALLQIGVVASGHIFSAITFNDRSGLYTFERTSLYPVYLIGMVALLVTVLYRLFVNFRATKRDPRERRAFRVVLVTVASVVAYGLLTNVVLPLATDSQNYIGFGVVTIDIFAIGFALSIIRDQFLDIRSYVFRALTYVLALLSITIAYVVAAALTSTRLFHVTLETRTFAILVSMTLLVAISFRPLVERFNHVTNRLFFRDYYEPQDLLDKLGNILVRTVNSDEIREQATLLLQKYIRPTSIMFMLTSDAGRNSFLMHLMQSGLNVVVPRQLDSKHAALLGAMKRQDAALAIRLHTKHEELGFIVFGFRQSGSDYSTADKKFLGVVADQLALGLQNALRFEEIERFNETLQQKIDEATKKLRHTNDKLRMLDQTKDDFISMASHQLRTPLTSVKGYVSMVLDGDAGKISPLQRKLLNQSFISSQRMVYLISDLLNVSRLRTGKFVIEPIPCNLAKIIRDEIEQLQETAKARNLTLTYNRPEHFPTLMLDETKMRQVIMNFIDNAIYYTPSGGHITVTLLDKPKTVEFTVTDDGIGVPKHEQHHLFTKFYRAHNARRARPDGTGLGLFMAKKVVVAQGGATIFSSQEGKGSTFGFSFAKNKLSAPILAEPNSK